MCMNIQNKFIRKNLRNVTVKCKKCREIYGGCMERRYTDYEKEVKNIYIPCPTCGEDKKIKILYLSREYKKPYMYEQEFY